MQNRLSRREFMEKGAGLGLSAALAGSFVKGVAARASASELADLAVVTGQDYGKNAVAAVDLLGGMQKFVPKNSKVALLANVQRSFPGTFTKPDILQAVIRMCRDAGAGEINCVSLLPEKNWEDTGLAEVIREEGVHLKLFDSRDTSRFRKIEVPKGKTLRQAEIVEEFFDNDIFINLPITKDHAGNKFTGTMKNLMGLNSGPNNRTFHKDDWETNKDSIAFLDQCIADLNTVIGPDLCIVDATEFITTNGPMGPGKLSRAQKVVAGVDRVAVDAYCTRLFGLEPADIVMINRGYEHGLGEIDLSKVNVREVNA